MGETGKIPVQQRLTMPEEEAKGQAEASLQSLQKAPVHNIDALIRPEDVIIDLGSPAVQDLGIEGRVRHYYSTIGIDFGEKTDFFEVFEIERIAGLLEDVGYKTDASKEDIKRVRKAMIQWPRSKDFTKMFVALFFEEEGLDYVNRNKRFPKIDSKYYNICSEITHDIALELNENNRGKGAMFACRAMNLLTIAASNEFVTRPMPASFYRLKMAQLLVERGIAQMGEYLANSIVLESIFAAKDQIDSCISNYRLTMYDLLKRSMQLLLAEIPEETSAEKLRNAALKLDFGNQITYDPHLPAHAAPVIDAAKEISAAIKNPQSKFLKSLEKTISIHGRVRAALADDAVYPAFEKEMNFFFRRLIILLDRYSQRFGSGDSYREQTDLFEEPFERLCRMGVKHKFAKRRDKQEEKITLPYSEIGSFRDMFLMYAKRG